MCFLNMCAVFIWQRQMTVIAFPNVYWIYSICMDVCVCVCVCVYLCVCIAYYKLTIFWFMGSIDTKAALKLHFHSAYQYMCQVSHQWTLVLNSSNFSICCNDSSLMIALWWETQAIPPVAPLLFYCLSLNITLQLLVCLLVFVSWPCKAGKVT